MSKTEIYVWKSKETGVISIDMPGIAMGLQPRDNPTAEDLYKQLEWFAENAGSEGYQIIIGRRTEPWYDTETHSSSSPNL